MLIQGSSDPPRLVRVWIDAAIVARHDRDRHDLYEAGGFSVVAFRVPNERDDSSTTQVQAPEETARGGSAQARCCEEENSRPAGWRRLCVGVRVRLRGYWGLATRRIF